MSCGWESVKSSPGCMRCNVISDTHHQVKTTVLSYSFGSLSTLLKEICIICMQKLGAVLTYSEQNKIILGFSATSHCTTFTGRNANQQDQWLVEMIFFFLLMIACTNLDCKFEIGQILKMKMLNMIKANVWCTVLYTLTFYTFRFLWPAK